MVKDFVRFCENFIKNFKDFMVLFMEFNCLKVSKPVREDSLLFAIQFPRVSGTHLINLGRMKDWIDLGATQWS